MHDQLDSTTPAAKSLRDSRQPTVHPMLAELVQRYPLMFQGPHTGLDMTWGWYPVFAQLCADIDARLGQFQSDFHWRQLKEKYGQPRWYASLKDAGGLAIDVTGLVRPRSLLAPEQEREALRDCLRDLVQAAETRCETRCMACGSSASLQRLKGWYTTCCPGHLDLLQREPDAFWRLVQQKPL